MVPQVAGFASSKRAMKHRSTTKTTPGQGREREARQISHARITPHILLCKGREGLLGSDRAEVDCRRRRIIRRKRGVSRYTAAAAACSAARICSRAGCIVRPMIVLEEKRSNRHCIRSNTTEQQHNNDNKQQKSTTRVLPGRLRRFSVPKASRSYSVKR